LLPDLPPRGMRLKLTMKCIQDDTEMQWISRPSRPAPLPPHNECPSHYSN
jgi:hypothetical protein